ncbi:MAG: D-alanine--D-alanine ligase family protein [Patescibacteria group bacterium]|nr:D-alanine--D-alanine ligase family protein [Patescibacteria group bacterium]
MIKIGVIFGGQSGEYEVSIVSARSVMDALDKKKYKITPIKISKKGVWVGIDNPIKFLKKLDIVFPLIHGTTGEDGGLQGFLEFFGIPYVGAGVMDSALGMDKIVQKRLFQQENLPVVDFVEMNSCLRRNDKGGNRNDKGGDILRRIGFPIFVKPARGGSSVGISLVKHAKNLDSALKLAKKYDSKVIVEGAVPENREFECAVLGNEKPKASVVGEVLASNEFYDYNAKYIDGKSEIIIPAKIPKQLSAQIRDMSIQAYKALDCSGMVRVDFLYDFKAKKLYLNEVNTIPGFTPISMYPKLWEASGLSYPKLLDELVKLGMKRHKQRQKLLSNL